MLWKKITIGTDINRWSSERSLYYQKFDQVTGGHWWDSVWFGFISGCATANHIVVLMQLQENAKKNLYFFFIDLKKALDEVPEDVYGGLWGN